MASASFDAATIPPFSSRNAIRILGSACAARSSTARGVALGERSSTRQSSQSSNVWARTEAMQASRTSVGVL